MTLMPVAEALARVLAYAEPLPPVRVPVLEAYGRVLTADVEALRTQPPADVSAMDGYAVRAVDLHEMPARLKVVGEVAAGHPFAGAVGAGQAARIFTGGLMPPGADTVVIQENTWSEEDAVVVEVSTGKGRHVRRKGLDFERGAILLCRGRRLSSRDLALAAAMNHPTLSVHRRPKLAVLATGDELVPPGFSPAPGEIVHSNGYATMALASAEGCDVLDLGLVPDRLEATVAAVRQARSAAVDILVTSGGVSVGDYDLVRHALTAEGFALSFWKVAIRPGRPMLYGHREGMHVLGLPGNPVSSYVCAIVFLLPLIRRLLGRSDLSLALEPALLGCDLPQNDERADYLRARLAPDESGHFIATPAPVQDSSMLAPLAEADCLLVREPHAPPAPNGSLCTIVRLPV